MPADEDVAFLMAELRRGNSDAAGALVERFYPELKRLAIANMAGEKPGHTWQATVLLNELYLELRRVKELSGRIARSPEDERRAFLGLAAHIMRRLLIVHARPLHKRAARVTAEALEDLPAGEDALREVGDLLDRLSAIDPRLRQVVEWKVFEGLSTEEMAARMGCATRSIARYWSFARSWLRGAVGD
jgi:RNA polymerase sigma factor (TIGR02999 family)